MKNSGTEGDRRFVMVMLRRMIRAAGGPHKITAEKLRDTLQDMGSVWELQSIECSPIEKDGSTKYAFYFRANLGNDPTPASIRIMEHVNSTGDSLNPLIREGMVRAANMAMIPRITLFQCSFTHFELPARPRPTATPVF